MAALNPINYFPYLPEEVKIEVLSRLYYPDLTLSVRLVCQQFSKIVAEEELWEKVAQHHYRMSHKTKELTWKETCKTRFSKSYLIALSKVKLKDRRKRIIARNIFFTITACHLKYPLSEDQKSLAKVCNNLMIKLSQIDNMPQESLAVFKRMEKTNIACYSDTYNEALLLYAQQNKEQEVCTILEKLDAKNKELWSTSCKSVFDLFTKEKYSQNLGPEEDNRQKRVRSSLQKSIHI